MSTTALKIISPRTSSGSFLLSLLVHGLIAGSVVVGMKLSPAAPAKVEEYLDLGYQTFDEPPEIVKEEQKVRTVVETTVPVEKNVAQESSAKELQDDSGDVTGTQKAAPVQQVASTGTGNATATPYYKIKPKYPKAALQAGTEGWVLMKIDILEDGSVENIEVLDGEQRNTFQAEARRAVSKWKYRPFVDQNGNPFRKTAHQVRVDFKLNETAEM